MPAFLWKNKPEFWVVIHYVLVCTFSSFPPWLALEIVIANLMKSQKLYILPKVGILLYCVCYES